MTIVEVLVPLQCVLGIEKNVKCDAGKKMHTEYLASQSGVITGFE